MRPDGAGPDSDIVAAGSELTPDLELLRLETLTWLEEQGAPIEETTTYMDAITEAALEGEIDVAAMEAILGSLEANDKAPRVLNLYAESVMEGYRLDQSLEPGAALGALALCNSCPTAQPAPAATDSCQFISGNTTSACQHDYYSIDLPANALCTFTTCTAGTCGGPGGATANYDSYLRIRRPGSCSQIAYNDDSCSGGWGLLSTVSHMTGASPETVVVEVEGFSTRYGSYNLGYVCQTGCMIDGRMGVQQSGQQFPKATWMSRRLPYRYYPATTCTNGDYCRSNVYNYYRDRPWDRWDMPANPTPECVTVTLSNPSSGGCRYTFGMAYTGTFPAGQGHSCNPAPGVQWLGDSYYYAYLGYYSRSFSFNLPANTPWSLIVMNYYYTSASGGHTNCDYNVMVTPCGETQTCAPGLTMSPTSASAGASCDANERFVFDFGHEDWIPPVRLDWTMTPPAGGTATGAVSGTMNITAATQSVTIPEIRMVRPNCPASGVFEMEASITNNCEAHGVNPEPTLERTFNYTINDDTPPLFGPREDICLWPPNHEMLCQDSLDVRPVTDNCGVEGLVMGAESCTSDQADDSVGDGHTTGDCEIAIDDVGGQQIVCTRAERSGTIGEGRTYTITGRARDACGNFTPSTTLQEVSVPHDMSEHPECISPL